MRPSRPELWLLAVAAAAACGGATRDVAATRASCEEQDRVRPADLSATPRADPAIERLAVALGRGLTADERTYQRLVRDLGAMRRADPSIATIDYRTGHDGRTIFLHPDRGGEEWARGNAAFDAMRRRFRAKSVSFPYSWVAVEFDGVYELQRLGAYFRRLPGVQSVDFNVLTGDGPSICVQADAPTWRYHFLDASGDCPAGCIDLRVVAFTSDPGGRIARIGEATPPAGGDQRLVEQAMTCGRAELDHLAHFTPACPP